jgi:putative redox protein
VGELSTSTNREMTQDSGLDAPDSELGARRSVQDQALGARRSALGPATPPSAERRALNSEHGVPSPGSPRPPNRVVVTWRGEGRFDTGRPGGPIARIDSSGETGQGPVDALLSALATCASVDVVEILKKRRTPVTSLEVEVVGTRVEGTPRRLQHVLLRFHIVGAGVERVHAERAIELAVNKYCSVRDSLDRQIGIEWELELGESGVGNGESGVGSQDS